MVGPHEMLLIGIGIAVTVTLFGGGKWMLKVLQGRKGQTPKA